MLDIREKFDNDISNIATQEQLESLRIDYIGKKGFISNHLKQLSLLPPEKRKSEGQAINLVKQYVIEKINQKKQAFITKQINDQLETEKIDVTLPARHNKIGSLHPVSFVIEEITNIFRKMGFSPVTGPEIEDDYHNFTALNIAENHPARQMHDTFYLEKNNKLLRTHTSSVQIHTMNNGSPPFAIIAPGKTYRSDSDTTHTPMFHQIEALYINKNVSMGHLKYCIKTFIDEFFGKDIKLRFRSSFFPFTEPSAEVDIGCKILTDTIDLNKAGDHLEIMGCGMVHPNILRELGIDTNIYNGFALGLGVERVAMLKYGIKDLRQFFNADKDWIKTFNFAPYV